MEDWMDWLGYVRCYSAVPCVFVCTNVWYPDAAAPVSIPLLSKPSGRFVGASRLYTVKP